MYCVHVYYCVVSATGGPGAKKKRKAAPHDNKSRAQAQQKKLSEKESKEELLRKLERNRRVFEAWLERKKEQQQVK